MRRLLLLGVLCAIPVLALAPASWATSYSVSSCEEIETQEMAQNTLDDPDYSIFSANGDEDELDLDPDGDGVACNNPGNLIGGKAPEEPVCVILAEGCDEGQYDKGQYEVTTDCVGFAPMGESPEEAQAVLAEDGSDPNGLDADGDGVACEFDATSTGEVSFEDGSGTVVDNAGPAPAEEETPSPSVEVSPVTPPPGADSPVFQPTEPDTAEVSPEQQTPQVAPRAQTPRSTTKPAELPATGGYGFLLPAGTTILGLGVLGLAAHRRSARA